MALHRFDWWASHMTKTPEALEISDKRDDHPSDTMFTDELYIRYNAL
jgi:hypothetical protein